jgi:hypothetical protein
LPAESKLNKIYNNADTSQKIPTTNSINYRYKKYLTGMVEPGYSIHYMRLSAQRLPTHGW